VTANASSLSATARLELDLIGAGRLPPLPVAWFAGRDRDLLAPLRFLAPGETLDASAPRVDRTALAAALATANAGYGHPRAAELAARLADPATRVVVTGQQPGVYGGPLLTLTKLAAAVRHAEALEAAGQPAVAVFWVATADHDWQEATRVAVRPRDGLRAFDLGPDPAPLRPLGLRTLGPTMASLESQVDDAFGIELAGERLEPARRFYRPEAGFGDAFCGFVTALLGARAPLMLDATLPELKRLQRPWFERLVDRRRELDANFARRDAAIESRGYPLQVRPQPGTSPLFLLAGGERRRIAWHGDDAYTLRGGDETPRPLGELLQVIAEEPERVSAGVLARPAIQDAVLGTSLLVMGPAEMSYLAQAGAAYEELGLEPPAAVLRPQVLVLEKRQRAHLDELGVTLAEILDRPVDEIVAERLGRDVVTPVKTDVLARFDALRGELEAIEEQLVRPWEKTRENLERSLDQLASKATAAVARRHEVWQRRLEQVREQCLPDGHLQERHLSVVHYLGRYGASFVDALWTQMDLDPRRLQALELEPGGAP